MCQVIKRNGTKEDFNFSKIENAVNRAFNAVYKTNAPEDLIDYLKTTSQTFEDNISVESIQDFVENTLMEFK